MEGVELKKAKTHRGRMYLESRKPKAVEDPKQCVFLNTNNSSELLRMVLNDLVKNLYEKNTLFFLIIPFENIIFY